MSAIRNHFLTRYFSLFMALYLLNCSVDAPDMQPEWVPEDLSYNDIESIVEWVTEDVLGLKDFIKEYDDNDNNSGAVVKKGVEIFYFMPTPNLEKPLLPLPDTFLSELQLVCHEDHFFNQFISEPATPPPWG